MNKIIEQKKLLSFKEEQIDDDFSVEYEILPAYNSEEFKDARRENIAESISALDEKSNELDAEISKLNIDVERLTNHADGIDYTVAVACGILCGLIDSLVVGEFDFKKAKAKSNRQVNEFITKFAKLQGYKGDRLNGAIDFLEKKFPVAQDNIWKGQNIGISAKNHHLDDFAHHPTLLGLVASVFVQFFRLGIFVNKDGEWKFEVISTEPQELLKIWLPVIISGLLMWIVHIVESNYQDKIDEKIPKPLQKIIKSLAAVPILIPVLKVAGNWVGHLVSDMGGSKNTAGGGMGIPGLFISLLHEMSGLPILKTTELPKIVNDLYVKQKIEMRSELAVFNELGRQAIPVLIGEILVRSFYFVRRLVQEVQKHGNFKEVNWHNVIPFKNRTIVRMMTIESGTFTAIDLADAAIHSAIEAGPPTTPAFWSKFVLRVNFVGIGRFVIAVGTDAGMGVKRQKLINERLQLKNKQLLLQNAKLFYIQEGIWLEAIDTEKAINDMCVTAKESMLYYADSWNKIAVSVKNIENDIKPAEENNPALTDDIKDILEWG